MTKPNPEKQVESPKAKRCAKWAVVTETKFVTLHGNLAWTADRAKADSCAASIPGARVVDASSFVREWNATIQHKWEPDFDTLGESAIYSPICGVCGKDHK